ncbi:MAG: DUF3047 domain-containing protein [Alphaproteobacteria bacterium]|nr:DUF3047 domain-containing protein [Alphaproteobacteria bacterium]
MKIPSLLALILLVSALLRADVPAVAASHANPSDLALNVPPAGWRHLTVPGKAATRFASGPDGAIKVSARDSAGFLVREIAAAKPVTRLAWRWRVDMAPPPTDQSMKGMDDRPLALHVWFDDGAAGRSPWTLFDRVGAWLFDVPLPGKVLTYVWGGKRMRGDSLKNPYLEENGRLIILRSGRAPNGQWLAESVDVAADFKRVFGYDAPPPRFIAISADTDDKRGVSMGAVTDLVLHM